MYIFVKRVDVNSYSLLAPTVFYSTTGNEITEITKKRQKKYLKILYLERGPWYISSDTMLCYPIKTQELKYSMAVTHLNCCHQMARPSNRICLFL